jgi:hypothetical protein
MLFKITACVTLELFMRSNSMYFIECMLDSVKLIMLSMCEFMTEFSLICDHRKTGFIKFATETTFDVTRLENAQFSGGFKSLVGSVFFE